MAYGKAYTLQAMAKTEPTETTYLCEIWQSDFVGSSMAFETGPAPITAQILANSDDPFDPILSSTLTLVLDITDFTDPLPDFTSTDDRRYWVKLYNGTYYVWQGFIIMDSISVHFSTGVILLNLLCTDGLAMLRNIPYEPTNPDVNVLESLSTVITNCLNKINFPDGYLLNYVCWIYANGMVSTASVFKQTYYPPRNLLATAPTQINVTASEISPYKTCYDVLTGILLSFGCQIFQSYGQWWIGNINERAENSVRRFQTTNLNGTESFTFALQTQREILPYADVTTTPWYFQEDIQTKILRKGYSKIDLVCPADFAPQMIDNGNFERITAGSPDNWTFDPGISGGTLVVNTFADRNVEILAGGAGGNPKFSPDSVGPVQRTDVITINFLSEGDLGVTPAPIFIEIKLIDGTDEWTFGSDSIWKLNYGGYNPYTTSNISYPRGTTTVTTLPAPTNGVLTIEFGMFVGSTITHWFLYNVVVSIENEYSERVIGNTYTSPSYKKTVSVPIGAPSRETANNQVGSLLDASGVALTGWARRGNPEDFNSLMRIIAQQYFNVQSRSVINLNCTLRNLIDSRTLIIPRSLPHIIGPMDNMTVQDTTGTTISIDGKFYLMGACSIDYVNDTITGTFLESNDIDLTTTFTDNLISK